MALIFYCLSGSPFSWKVWLSLESKNLAYGLKLLSADAGELRSPAFKEISPRGKVPVIVDDGFVLAESSAIVEYLEDRYSRSGATLWPRDVKARAIARRIAAESDNYVYPHVRRLVVELLMRRGQSDADVVAEAKSALVSELAEMEMAVIGPFAAGAEPCAADFALYPLMAILRRIGAMRPASDIGSAMPAGVRDWMSRMEELPYFGKTIPPHWRQS
ncbi:glutathione S-transferase family protein [Bradyrhizobium sediminis]|uniref:Glutathione S-transferase family protein n=1 Tax=Bradyrhizobium sediminis TaxID=2840469 RepID=A0A975NVB3_9BRAD|nr:glutathione S-transferase family protein [Bradyrhizobium sediminis]QWG22053.1 glutathione S-transferase family protein [Bradyrhizobium sediminis]